MFLAAYDCLPLTRVFPKIMSLINQILRAILRVNISMNYIEIMVSYRRVPQMTYNCSPGGSLLSSFSSNSMSASRSAFVTFESSRSSLAIDTDSNLETMLPQSA